MKFPSNTTLEQWKNGSSYNYDSDEAFWYLVNHQIDARNKDDKRWCETCSIDYRVQGGSIEEIVRDKFGWKSGDIKNGFRGIKVNGFYRKGRTESSKDLEIKDLKRRLTPDANGMSISINLKTFVIYNP